MTATEKRMQVKKFNLKTRMQISWFQAAMLGMTVGLLIAPAAGSVLSDGEKEFLTDNALVRSISSISFGPQTKVMLNGTVVALAKNEEEAKQAYKQARLSYNKDGVRTLPVEVSYEQVDREQDTNAVKGLRVLRGEKLQQAILDSFSSYAQSDKKLAYTVRVDDYTVTVEHMEDVLDVLEATQNTYDVDDRFRVGLKTPASQNVTMYEVDVEETAEEPQQETAVPSEDTVAVQGVGDGVKYVGFAEDIQVVETYVNAGEIKDKETVYAEMTTKNAEASIYVVEPGDVLSVIAEKNNMTVEDIKALNPQIESDDDIYYDDRLNITVPKAAIQVLVEKQETYREDYNVDVVYEDDDSMYIGESEVVQEGTPGSHVVTDLVTYKDDVESEREELQETVEVAAVAQVIRRGTKSKPTYMYPVTNWNVTSNFGYRWGRLHAGTDVGVPIGTTVRASRGGQVITAGWVGGYGNCVIIDHGDGVCTRYGHLNEVTVSVGQYVDQGQQIALSGNTGRSTGPHLHFEIRINGEAVDPTPYLAGEN